MTTLEFAKENRQQVIENCPEGVSLNRFMNEFLAKFEMVSKEYGFVGFSSFNDALTDTVDATYTDDQINGIKSNNFLQDHNIEVNKNLMSIR